MAVESTDAGPVDPGRIDTSGSALRVPRSRGALGGLLLLILGVWGALIPFIGPLFSFAFTPDTAWTWTAARGWLEVLPGAVTAVGGLVLLASANRITASLGAWLGVAGGAWFVVGPQLAPVLHVGSIGTPTSTSSGVRALESLAYFYGLGAVILFLAAGALGRLSVRSIRDVKAARRRQAEVARTRAAQERAVRERVLAERGQGDRGVEQNRHAHRHFGLRRGASQDQPAPGEQSDYQAAHSQEQPADASTANPDR